VAHFELCRAVLIEAEVEIFIAGYVRPGIFLDDLEYN